jgi:hypothetical protein
MLKYVYLGLRGVRVSSLTAVKETARLWWVSYGNISNHETYRFLTFRLQSVNYYGNSAELQERVGGQNSYGFTSKNPTWNCIGVYHVNSRWLQADICCRYYFRYRRLLSVRSFHQYSWFILPSCVKLDMQYCEASVYFINKYFFLSPLSRKSNDILKNSIVRKLKCSSNKVF